MKLWLLALLISSSALGNENNWRHLLSKPVDDEWQQVFGFSLYQKKAREKETLAAKLEAIQKMILKDHGEILPIYLPPSFAAYEVDRIPATTETVTGLPISNASASEVLRYIAAIYQYEIVETKVGVVFRPIEPGEQGFAGEIC